MGYENPMGMILYLQRIYMTDLYHFDLWNAAASRMEQRKTGPGSIERGKKKPLLCGSQLNACTAKIKKVHKTPWKLIIYISKKDRKAKTFTLEY